MNWSSSKQKMARSLDAIARARRSAAQTELQSASRLLQEARKAAQEAETSLSNAEAEWAEQLKSKTFDPQLQLAFAKGLLFRHHETSERIAEKEEALHAADRARSNWQGLEARVRSGELALKRGRLVLKRRSEDKRGQELAERATWTWFRR